MKTTKIAGEIREQIGKKDAVALRRAERVPCELYGGEENIHFSIDELALSKVLHTPDVFEFHIDINGTEYRAVMKEIQYHPVTDRPLHADFLLMEDGKEVTVELPVKLQGNAEGVRAGGKLNVLMRRIGVRGVPNALPESIDIDIAPMLIGDSVRIRDIKLDGVELLAADSAVIVSVKTSRKAMAAAAAEEGAEGDEGEGDAEGGEAEG